MPRSTALIDEQRLLPTEPHAETPESASLLQRMRQIGRRTAELHLAFASDADDRRLSRRSRSRRTMRRAGRDAIGSARSARSTLLRAQHADACRSRLPALAEQLLGTRDAIARAHLEGRERNPMAA